MNYVYIAASIAILIVGIGATISMVRHGGKLGWKGVSFVVQGTGQEVKGPMSQALYRVETEVPDVKAILFRRYLSLMESNGAIKEHLASYDDSRFMNLLLRYAVSGGNGSNSTQKIMEAEVLQGYYRRHQDDLEEYVSTHVLPLVLRRIRDQINSEYDSSVMRKDGTMRDRWVSSTEYILDLSTARVQKEVAAVLVRILRYARDCMGPGCK